MRSPRIECNQIGVVGQRRWGDHGDEGHLGVDDPAGRGHGNRFLVGDDGRTACSRVRHNGVHGKVCELAGFGQAQEEQQAVAEEGSFGAEVSRCHTWVGYYDRSNEHTKEGWKLRSWSFYLVQKIHKII